MAKAKQPTYTMFLLLKEFIPDAAVEMMADLSQAQCEGREPLHPLDVEFVEGLLRAEEAHARMENLGMGPLFS